jgi:hypothetical protein
VFARMIGPGEMPQKCLSMAGQRVRKGTALTVDGKHGLADAKRRAGDLGDVPVVRPRRRSAADSEARVEVHLRRVHELVQLDECRRRRCCWCTSIAMVVVLEPQAETETQRERERGEHARADEQRASG